MTSRTPPTFLVHAEDDATVPVGNTLDLRVALVAAGVPVETHLFTHGGRGFGLRRDGKARRRLPRPVPELGQVDGLRLSASTK